MGHRVVIVKCVIDYDVVVSDGCFRDNVCGDGQEQDAISLMFEPPLLNVWPFSSCLATPNFPIKYYPHACISDLLYQPLP